MKNKSITQPSLKAKRLNAIKRLIANYAIEDQSQLVELLEEKYDIAVNQSIASRDLREIGAVKRSRNDKLIYELDAVDPTQEILHRAILSIEHNETTIVIHTMGGLADFVGDFLDNEHHKDILATLAGENVVIVIPRSIRSIQKTYSSICKLVHYKG